MLTAREVLDRYFLDSRCQLLEIAATLDRHDRAAAGQGTPHDPRREKIARALEILADRTAPPERAETLLRLFSDPAE